MRVYNFQEAFVEAYKIYKERNGIGYEEILSVFHLEDEQSSRESKEDIANTRIIVDKVTMGKIDSLSTSMSRKNRYKDASKLFRLWALIIVGKDASDLDVERLYIELSKVKQIFYSNTVN